MNENELSDAFERALPEQPLTKGWAGKVRRRRQRHRTIVGAAAVAVVAAVAIPLGLSLDSGPQVMTTPAPATTEQGSPLDGEAVPAACLEAQEQHFDLEKPANGNLPKGATGLWLCGSDTRLDHNDQLTFIGPREALTTGVDAAVDAFNDLTWQEGVAIDCASSGEVYHLLVDYPDGTRRSVTGNFAPQGCQHFDVHDGIVEGADEYLGTLQGLWDAQRADDGRPRTDVDLCPGSTSVFTVSTADVRRGAACVVQRGGSETRIIDDLPRELLVPILEGIAADGEPLDHYEPYGSDQQVVLFSEHGDPVTLYWGQWQGATGFVWHNPQRLVWSPEAALRDRIDDYFAQVTGQPTAGPTGPAEEPDAASPLPGAQPCYNDDGSPVTWQQDESGPAEPGAVRAWLCGDYSPDTGMGTVGPVEPLTSGLDTLVSDVQAADEVNLAVITCPAEDNLSFNVVLEYEDGTRHIVGGDRRGCRTTYDGGVVREGGEDFHSALIAAWEAQRETEGGTGGGGDAGLCPGPPSLMRMKFEDAVRGSVCVRDADDWGTTHSISDLSGEVVAEVAESMGDQLETLDEDLPPGSPSAPEQSVWLTLSNTYDDHLTLVRHEDGTYQVRDGEGPQWTWVPPPDLSLRLQELLVAAGGTDVPTIDG